MNDEIVDNDSVEEQVIEEAVKEEVTSKPRRSHSSSPSLEVSVVFSYPFRLGMLVYGDDKNYYILPHGEHAKSRQRVQVVKKTSLIPADFDVLSREVPNIKERLQLN